VASTDGGNSWQAQVSSAPQALTSVACADTVDCFAGGGIGTVVATNTAGASWYQEGNPISGPATSLNAGPTTITAIDGAACSQAACFMATGSSGNIMMTPLLTVTVNASGAFGTNPNLTDLGPGSPAISYSPSSAASDVTGGLSCSTTATASSDAGSYPISGCSGLSANGYNVVYDYTDSSYQVTQASNTITFAGIPGQTYGNPSFQIDPTASSGLPVSLQATGNCSLDSATAPADVTITDAGSCSITASQAGNNDYAAAQNVTQTFSIAQASQIIDFTSPSPHTYGDPSFEIDPTATSGLTVSLSSSGPCSLSSGTSPAQVSITGAGQCSITASQGGDTDYSAAQSVTQTFNIALANQTISFGQLPDQTYGAGPITLSATASSGLPITYFTAGGCAVSGDTLTIVSGGTCTVLATQPGNGNYNPAPDVQQSFNVAPASQTITFHALQNRKFGHAPLQLTATASSGLPISYSVGATDACSVSGSTLTLTGAGSCTVTAAQSGNSDYTAAQPVSQTFQISMGTPKVVVTHTPSPPKLGSVTYHVTVKGFSGTAATGSVTVSDGTDTCSIDSLSAGAGACSIDEAAGSYTVSASYSGDSNYLAATGSVKETVQRVKPTVTITPSANPAPAPGPVSYLVSVVGVNGFTPAGDVTVTDGHGGSCAISLSGGGGSCDISEAKGSYGVTAQYAGSSQYKGASKFVEERVQ
jgi:Bacterial Ig-like domain (group 3)